MDETRDIMVHGIPNVPDANAILRDELDVHIDRFGPIKWLRLGSNRGFHNTNYGFLRYENEHVHQEAIDFLNHVGIPDTRIWFELNPRPTQVNHILQEAPAAPRVQRQLDQLARLEQQLRDQDRALAQETTRLREEVEATKQRAAMVETQLRRQVEASNQRVATLETQINESRQLVQDLLNQQATVPEEPPRAWVPLPFRRLQTRLNQDSRSQPAEQPEHMPIRTLPRPPREKLHQFNQGQCPVCLNLFVERNSVVTTLCGHLFCEDCMFRWVHEAQLNCPECRTRLGYNLYIRLHSRD